MFINRFSPVLLLIICLVFPCAMYVMTASHASAAQPQEQQINDRQASPLEACIHQLIDDPTNRQLRSQLANAFYAHLKTLDLSDMSKITWQMIIPAVTWNQVPPIAGDPFYGPKHQLQFDSAEYLYQHTPTMDAIALFKWQYAINIYDRILSHFPHQGALSRRSNMNLMLGRYKDAFEDMAVSVVMSAYAWSRIYDPTKAQPNNWFYAGIPKVMVLADLAYDNIQEDGQFPSAPLMNMLEAYRQNDWMKVCQYVTFNNSKYASTSHADGYFAGLFRYNNGLQTKLLDTLASACEATKDETQKKRYIADAEIIFSMGHPYFEWIKLRGMADPSQDVPNLKRVLNDYRYDNYYDARLNIEYAKMLEKQSETDAAMLHYNVAALGLPASKLMGINKLAAENRDRLEGTREAGAIIQRYLSLQKAVTENTRQGSYTRSAQAQLVMLINRLESVSKLNNYAYLLRADGRRATRNYHGAIEDLRRVIANDKSQAGKLTAIIGLNAMDLVDMPFAISALTDAMKIEGTPNWVYAKRAMCFYLTGEYQQALRDYDKMLELEPEMASSLYARSEIYQYILKDYEKAFADLSKYKAIQLNKDSKFKNRMLNHRFYQLRQAGYPSEPIDKQ